MQDVVGLRRRSLLLKGIITVFLPVIIFVWFAGWMLMLLGELKESADFGKEVLRTRPSFDIGVKEAETLEEQVILQ